MNLATVVKNQREFYQTHQTKELRTRIENLKKLQIAIKNHELQIFEALQKDLNKSSFETYMTELGLVYEEIRYFLHHLPSLMKPKKVRTPLALFHAKSYRYSEPYGVVLVMSPWNYPFQLTMVPVIGAIAGGNTVVVKPASYTPHVSQIIQDILHGIFPEEYVVVIQGGREANQALLEQRFDYIFFTGSPTVGKLVMEKASAHLTPVTLELGGKSPCIVYDTVNVKLAAKRVAFGKFLNSGQTCIAPDYCIIEERLLKPFLDAMKESIHEFFGDDILHRDDLVKIINSHHHQRLLNLIPQDRILLGGSHREPWIEPTVVGPVSIDDPIMQEEIFGPILPIIVVKSIQEVESFLQQMEKPLAFYLFTDNRAIKKGLLHRISFGGATINDTIMHIASTKLGFGGVGNSGMGQYHGFYSYQTFSHFKSVLVRSKWIDLPLRYRPYTKSKFSILRKFMK